MVPTKVLEYFINDNKLYEMVKQIGRMVFKDWTSWKAFIELALQDGGVEELHKWQSANGQATTVDELGQPTQEEKKEVVLKVENEAM